MRPPLKRCTCDGCTRAHSEVCTRTLHHPRASAESVARSTNSNAAACSLSTPRGAGLSPCTERHSAGYAKQRAAGPRWPEEPLAQLSWASPRTAGAQSQAGICETATRHVSRSPEPLRQDAAARLSRGSAALLDKRLLSGEGRATTRLQMPVWHATTGSAWLRRSLRPGGVTRLSTGSPRSSPGSLPALLDLGALLLRQLRHEVPKK